MLKNVGEKTEKEFSLKISKTLEGKVLIKDHPLIFILIDPLERKVITLPKSDAEEDSFQAQKGLIDKLFVKGLLALGSAQGGITYGSLEARYAEDEKRVSVIKALLLAVAEFLEEEEELYDTIKSYEDDITDYYLDPDEEHSTELGEVPQAGRKGTVPDQPFGKYGGYFGYFY